MGDFKRPRFEKFFLTLAKIIQSGPQISKKYVELVNIVIKYESRMEERIENKISEIFAVYIPAFLQYFPVSRCD